MGRADRTQQNSISHTGNTFGEDKVELMNNQTDPVDKSPVISFEGPQQYEQTEYVGRRHPTNFVPRTVEEHEADGSGEVTLDARIQPVAGEEDVDEQDYPAVQIVNTAGEESEELEIEDVDYAAGTVHLAEEQTDGDALKAYPIITTGTAQYQGVNQFGQIEGPADKWETPLFRWHDMDQEKRGTRVKLQGRVEWGRHEQLELHVESEEEVVWEDEDYPGAYVSSFEQQVEITL